MIWLGSNGARAFATRALGGLVSGTVSGVVQGKDAATTARGAAINGLVSGLNPFGFIGSPVARGGFTSAASNLANQGAGIAIQGGGEVNWTAVTLAGLGRMAFGGAMGSNFSPSGVVQTIQFNFGSGYASAAAGHATSTVQSGW